MLNFNRKDSENNTETLFSTVLNHKVSGSVMLYNLIAETQQSI